MTSMAILLKSTAVTLLLSYESVDALRIFQSQAPVRSLFRATPRQFQRKSPCVTNCDKATSLNMLSSFQSLRTTRSQATSSSATCIHLSSTASFSNSISLQDALPLKPRFALNIKGKILTIWGVLYTISALVLAMTVLPIMIVSAFVCNIRGNGKRRLILDWIIHIWAKLTMLSLGTAPQVYGLENLPQQQQGNGKDSSEVCVYVPNHTSFMDILLLSGFIPRPFKYLSKEEIKYIPIIGFAMHLAQHVFLKRDDLKSTLEVTESVIQRLKDGNSMVLFAEGTRSPDGRLKAMKKGAFQMAKAAGVKIVPISIGNLHRWMPKEALMPLAPIRNTYIKIHAPIDTKDLPLSQIRAQCLQAVNNGLPSFQQMEGTGSGSGDGGGGGGGVVVVA